jgi:hypothetical protein
MCDVEDVGVDRKANIRKANNNDTNSNLARAIPPPPFTI